MLKRALLQKITREMELHQTSGGGLIQFKCNALEDKEITSALYCASQAGVRIQLILRDSCRLRPGIAGLSENISVISIVGRFLEHARVYYFRNGGKEEYYIGSADLMKRNLEARVEVVTPIEDADLQAQLREMLNAQLENTRSGWEMDADGHYTQRQPTGDKEQTIHDVLIGLAEKRQSKISDTKKKKKNIRQAGKKKKRN